MEHIYTKQQSKFISYNLPISTQKEIEEHLAAIRKKHNKATHVVYAYKLGDEEAFKHDGEVGGVGKVLLGLVKENHLLVVVRYYGGKKLGVGGVRKAFQVSAQQAIKTTE